ncbi:MAG: polysaccharide export protein, partial [Bradyrhizobium sp.]|nr:polysaccharide export protein [Bradyrhizobium sp.]
MRVARAFRFSITAMMAALALSGCMRTPGPMAVAPQGIDAMTYGAAAAPVTVVDNSGGGAISALRGSFARAPRPVYASAPVVVAAPVAYAEPMRYDSSYHLDAGDKLRVVVYGQEG